MLTNAHLADVRFLAMLTPGEAHYIYADGVDSIGLSPNVFRKQVSARALIAQQEYSRLRYHFPRHGGFNVHRRFSNTHGTWIIWVTFTGLSI